MPFDLTEIGLVEFFKKSQIDIFSVVSITSSYNGDNLTKIFADIIPGQYSWSCNDDYTRPHWIQFSFNNTYIDVSWYLFKSSSNEKNTAFHLKNWRIAGSNNNITWKTIKEHKNSDDVNAKYKTFKFETQRGIFKYLKLEQTGVNWGETYGFAVNHMDFYGILYDDPRTFPINYCTNLCKNRESFIYYTFLFISISWLSNIPIQYYIKKN